jgi:hypothetical protein
LPKALHSQCESAPSLASATGREGKKSLCLSHSFFQALVHHVRLHKRTLVMHDVTWAVSFANDKATKLHLHEIKDVLKLLNERQSLDTGLVAANNDDISLFLSHRRFEVKPFVPQTLRPAVDEILHWPGHPVPIQRGRKYENIVSEHLFNDFIVIVIHILKPRRVVAPVVNRQNALVREINPSAVHSIRESVRQYFCITVFP